MPDMNADKKKVLEVCKDCHSIFTARQLTVPQCVMVLQTLLAHAFSVVDPKDRDRAIELFVDLLKQGMTEMERKEDTV